MRNTFSNEFMHWNVNIHYTTHYNIYMYLLIPISLLYSTFVYYLQRSERDRVIEKEKEKRKINDSTGFQINQIV